MKVLKSEKEAKKDILVQWTPIFGSENKHIDLVGRFAGHGAFTECCTGDIYSLGGMSPASR